MTIQRGVATMSLFTALIFVSSGLSGATQTDSLFMSEDIIRMELHADFDSIQAERTGTAQYHRAQLIYYEAGGEAVRLNVKLILRGHYRKDTANCNFPPLFVNFRKSEVPNTIFRDQNELKLVTPCRDEKDVVDEYLVYKMYNKVTDLSLKARLVKMLYYDTRTKTKLFEKYSFFLEKKEHAAERNNAVLRDLVVTGRDLDRDNFKKMSVFQYIIGNGDWYFTLNHNIIIMVPKDSCCAPYGVPYDFDLSSFVNTDYGRFQATGRVYKGLCLSPQEYQELFDFYRKLKPEFEAIINENHEASKTAKKKMVNYIDYFYKVIEDPKLVKKEFQDMCEKAIDYMIRFK